MASRKSRSLTRAERRHQALTVARALRPAENRYAEALRGMAGAWAKAYQKELSPFIESLKDDARQDADRKLPSTFTMLGVRVDAAIQRNVGDVFNRMASDVKKANSKTLEVIGITPKDTGLTKFVNERRKENVELLRKAHGDYVDKVRDLFENPDNFGMRSETLAERLAERGDVSQSRAELIARDQTLTLNGQITKERQTSAGVERYTWSTSLDERVRPEHAALEGQVFDWDNPPAVGHPGDDVLCRCVAIPIIEELEGLYGEGAAAAEVPAQAEPAVQLLPPPLQVPAPPPVFVEPLPQPRPVYQAPPIEGVAPRKGLQLKDLTETNPPQGFDEYAAPRSLPSGESRTEYEARVRKAVENLTPEQIEAIQIFTGLGYGNIRRSEEQGQPNQDAKEIAKAFQNALREPGTAYRGIKDVPYKVVREWLQQDGTFRLGKGNAGATTSTAWHSGVSVTKFMGGTDDPESDYKVLFQIQHTSGIPIETISSTGAAETEILLPADAEFKIQRIARWEGKQRILVIELKED